MIKEVYVPLVISKDWQQKTIGDLVKFSGGSQPPRSTFIFEPKEDYIRLIQIRDYKSDKYATYIPKKLAKKFCSKTDIMIGRYGPPIFQILRGIEGAYNVALIKAIPSPMLAQEFMYYFLKQDSLLTFIENLSQRTSGQTGIEMNELNAYPMPLPPLSEQHKISSILNIWDNAIEKTEQLIKAKTKLKKALMQQLLTGKKRFKEFIKSDKYIQTAIGLIPEDWEPKTIGDLIQFSGGAQPPRSAFIFEPKEGYIRLIQIRDYKTDKYATYIPTKLARKFCSKTDIMIGRYGPPIFQILRGIEGAYNVALIKAMPCPDIAQDFMYYFLKQDVLLTFIESLSQRTSGQTGIEMNELNAYSMPLPPLPEQHKIASVLTDADKELDLLQKKLDTLKQQKKGLMQKLLTGQIRVNIDQTELQEDNREGISELTKVGT